MRKAQIERNTKETQIKIDLCLDGGDVEVSTGIGFFACGFRCSRRLWLKN